MSPPLEPVPAGLTMLPASNPASSQPTAYVNRPALVWVRHQQIEADRVLAKALLAGRTENAHDDTEIAALRAAVSPWRLYGVPALVGALGLGLAVAAGWGGYELGHAAK